MEGVCLSRFKVSVCTAQTLEAELNRMCAEGWVYKGLFDPTQGSMEWRIVWYKEDISQP